MKNRPTKLLPAVLIVAAAAWETVSTLRAGQDVPDDAAWAEAAELVRAEHRPGDLIVFAPPWIDPVGRKHLGDLISIDDAARMDAARFATLWEVSIRGERAAETAGLISEWEKRVAGVTVRKVRQTPAVVVTDFLSLLGSARSEGKRAQGPSLELAEVGFEPHRCIQVVPQPGQSVRITFPRALLGAQLVGYVGLADVFKRRDVRDPARLAVEIGGREVASTTVGVDSGWVRFTANTVPGPADVTFVATAIGAKARDRLVCFAAEARR